MELDEIPFNKPYMAGKELSYIAEAHNNGMLAGDGSFTRLCHQWLEKNTGCKRALLTHSCTAALEMSALLLDIQPNDEIIMPSYTFVSTANAFVLRGAVPIFVDIRADTLNIDEHLIEAAITSRTKAIVPVHYAGVACEMDSIMAIAKHYGLAVIEDAAQGVMSSYKGKALGSIGSLGAYSFHETKNIISGEGGALLVNDPALERRAEIIREKGTDRSSFFRQEVEVYTWQDIGSSYLPGELIAAFLWAQFEQAQHITHKRRDSWTYYHNTLESLETKGLLRRPVILKDCQHNAHMYYIILSVGISRKRVLDQLRERGVNAVFHYIPLHASPAGRHYGRTSQSLIVTNEQSERLIRLPLWIGISKQQQDYIVESLAQIIWKLR
ncbi:MAG TPA: dTDP-4-amino-4,6-dideoxygalactose transaminase [Leucothrix mucor]|uniref:dTDP-4-amino-4,6-dideoxygalactose transaminase n=1 Tax=Leucothrix mucor TaxID=45248 RepID=A0A7V2T2I5_LEUMU|nr:dTDP-4-amino-4,6-dideoxygalactose transaminase [Leucothrix mucor]